MEEPLVARSEAQIIGDDINLESENPHVSEETRDKIQNLDDLEPKKDLGITAETAKSVPSTAVEKFTVSHSQPLLKKSLDSSLWIRGIGPNTKAADLQVFHQHILRFYASSRPVIPLL